MDWAGSNANDALRGAGSAEALPACDLRVRKPLNSWSGVCWMDACLAFHTSAAVRLNHRSLRCV